MAASGSGYGRGGDVAVGGAALESFCLAGPALALGLGDAGQEVVPDISESAALVRGNPQEGAPDVPLTELTTAPAWPPSRATASDRTGARVLSALIGHCGWRSGSAGIACRRSTAARGGRDDRAGRQGQGRCGAEGGPGRPGGGNRGSAAAVRAARRERR